MSGAAGEGAVWAAPWGPSPALDAVAGRAAARGLTIVGPPADPAAAVAGPTLRFGPEPSALEVAAAALRDRYGRLDGLLFVLPALLPAGGGVTAALAELSGLEAARAGLGPTLPWVLCLPTAAGRRADAGPELALAGAARGLRAADGARGGRGVVIELPAAVWGGAPISGAAGLAVDRALAGGMLPWGLGALRRWRSA
ncbi:MAG: hypothetical protein JNM72_22855 [Deltaproteobacteria bacterium]|nr:hypothetical protein [Deltaproteobacteria bacterium]